MTMTSTSYQMCCVEEWVNFKMSLASYIYNTLSKYLHHTLQHQQKQILQRVAFVQDMDMHSKFWTYTLFNCISLWSN